MSGGLDSTRAATSITILPVSIIALLTPGPQTIPTFFLHTLRGVHPSHVAVIVLPDLALQCTALVVVKRIVASLSGLALAVTTLGENSWGLTGIVVE